MNRKEMKYFDEIQKLLFEASTICPPNSLQGGLETVRAMKYMVQPLSRAIDYLINISWNKEYSPYTYKNIEEIIKSVKEWNEHSLAQDIKSTPKTLENYIEDLERNHK